MIYHLNGKLIEVNPAYAVVECNGVGYLVHITIQTYSAIVDSSSVKLFIFPVYKEDSQSLFGFVDKGEREIFTKLISVSGVGGNTARVILSSLTTEEVVTAISQEDVATLKSIKGIGAKTAQRIIVDLKDKVGGIEVEDSTVVGNGSALKTEAVSALEVLGYNPKQTNKLITSIQKQKPEAGLEGLIKEALKRL